MDAHSAAHKEAYEIVNTVIKSLNERIRSGEIADEDGLTDAMHEELDSALIYTRAHHVCVFGLPDGEDAIESGACSPSNFGEALAAQAYANLRAAVESHDFSDAFAVASDAVMESEGGRVVSTPTYQHDCEKCVFLGDSDGHDLYFCPSSLGGSVLARYGSGPYEYVSSDAGIWIRAGWLEREPSHPLSVAIEAAQSRGLVARSSLVLFGNSVWRVEGGES